MRRDGNSNAELTIAARTRSRLSCTAASGRPTMLNDGRRRDHVGLDVDGVALEAGEGALATLASTSASPAVSPHATARQSAVKAAGRWRTAAG